MKPIITLLASMANPILQRAESKIPDFREKCKNPAFFKTLLNSEGEKSWQSLKLTYLHPLKELLQKVFEECKKAQSLETFNAEETQILTGFLDRCKRMIEFMDEIETTVETKIHESKK